MPINWKDISSSYKSKIVQWLRTLSQFSLKFGLCLKQATHPIPLVLSLPELDTLSLEIMKSYCETHIHG